MGRGVSYEIDTTSVTYARLLAAAELAEATNNPGDAVKWRSAADDIFNAAHKYLYNTERKAFYKGLIVKDGIVEYNDTFDMSSVLVIYVWAIPSW